MEQVLEDATTVRVRQKVASPIVLLFALSVILNAFGMIGIWMVIMDTRDIAGDTEALIQDIESRNSQETIIIQEERLESLIVRIECAERKIVQDVLSALVEGGTLPPEATSHIISNCPDD